MRVTNTLTLDQVCTDLCVQLLDVYTRHLAWKEDPDVRAASDVVPPVVSSWREDSCSRIIRWFDGPYDWARHVRTGGVHGDRYWDLIVDWRFSEIQAYAICVRFALNVPDCVDVKIVNGYSIVVRWA